MAQPPDPNRRIFPKRLASARVGDRIAVYQAPPQTRWERFRSRLLSPWTLLLSTVAAVSVLLFFGYFWVEYSDLVDRRLMSGEVFTPSAGIYSAPKTLRVGEQISRDALIGYLRSAGYIESNVKADSSRSRYSTDDKGTLAIEPGIGGVIDGVRAYPSLRVAFTRDGNGVDSIHNIDSGSSDATAQLEPRLLSSVAAEGNGRRISVKFDDLPQHLVKAITVTEDRSFFDHYGVNFRGIARALWRRYNKPDEDSPLANQGGSSITQQLVKNLLLTNDPTIERKLKEALMSVIVETRLTKPEIFTLYANQIYLGQEVGASIYGVGEASRSYFGKDVSQLTLAESAFLAGLIRSPNRYNPYKNPEKMRERRNQVLQSMLEEGAISQGEFRSAHDSEIKLMPRRGSPDSYGMPYFSQYVIDRLPDVVSDPEALQNLRVYTSIDPDLQRIAYNSVATRVAKLEARFPKKPKGSLNAALVALRPKTGEIVAMVGGRNFADNQFNRATMAKRQPGSAFKPFVYAAALNTPYEGSRVFSAASMLRDEKKIFTFGSDTYAPKNYGDTFSNTEITLRDALVRSKNTVTVDLGIQLNIGRVMDLAAKSGFPKVDKAYPSMALGTAEATPLQVATAYTVLANLGDRVDPRAIVRVTAGDGSTRVAPTPEKKNVLRPDVAFVTDDILKDVIDRGTAAGAQAWGLKNVAGKLGIAGKTGTSRDGWFAGFTPELVCVVYVGFDDNDDLGMKGSDSAMPIWADFMKAALDLHPDWNSDWAMPAGIRKAEIDIRTGSLLRELDTPTSSPTPQPTAAGGNAANGSSIPLPPDIAAWQTESVPDPYEVYVTNVPAQFRRVEYFIGGTLPNRALRPVVDEAPPPLDPLATGTPPAPSPTPEGMTPGGPMYDSPTRPRRQLISVLICPVSRMRAGPACPPAVSEYFPEGEEPKKICPIHR